MFVIVFKCFLEAVIDDESEPKDQSNQLYETKAQTERHHQSQKQQKTREATNQSHRVQKTSSSFGKKRSM